MGEDHRGTPSNVAAYDADDNKNFRVHSHCMKQPPSDSIMPYLSRAGFDMVSQITVKSVDTALVLALVERWRPETHMFHLSIGECTVTLQDVRMLIGLRIDGMTVNGQTQELGNVYMRHLGVQPPENAISGGSIRITWLDGMLEQLRAIQQPTDAQNMLHAKIYIVLLIAKKIFSDKSQNLLHSSWIPLVGDIDKCGTYSWGSACLAHLYINLCRTAGKDARGIAGCALLL
ncbi:protein MAIN-LIKE 2-like [Vicia villosa]|uniref:protein MAIN-LIKE 2-like n=1 Tax=Vicia villosa TaxID=3911 RepID=UPI00273C7B18|nr:protein MAIN-LIKE 2-like [Vicia villosa]